MGDRELLCERGTMKRYKVKEIFYSLQGEGARAGSANVFVRFAGCNLQCEMNAHSRSPGGFVCDTDFQRGDSYTAVELGAAIIDAMDDQECQWVILTGGEPLLQVDDQLLGFLQGMKFKIAIETNGTLPAPNHYDWLCVSPKVSERSLKINAADELRYVIRNGQELPQPSIRGRRYYLSPAWDGDLPNKANLEWCIKLCKENPQWRLSIQQHKVWGVR